MDIKEAENLYDKLACFPRALKIPPVTAELPSKTWNKATRGKIPPTSETTSVMFKKEEKMALVTWNREDAETQTHLDHC